MVRLLKTYLRPYRRQLLLVVALTAVQAMGNLYLPRLNADIINSGVAKGDTAYIMRTGGVMLLASLLLAVAAIAAAYWAAKTAMSFGRDVRGAVFRAVEGFSQREMNLFGAPSLITRNTNDVQQVQQTLVFMLSMMIMAPIMAVGGVIMALREDVPLSSVLVVIIPVMAIVVGSLLRRALPLFRSMQVKVDRVNQVMREKLAGIRVIRAFVRTDYERARFDGANADLTATALAVNRMIALMMPSLMLILNLSTVAVMWFGGLRIDSGAMPIGNLTAFITYIMQILISVMMATLMSIMIPRAAVSADRIQEVLEAEPSVLDPDEPAPEPSGRGHIEFRDVEFRYPGAEAPVISGVSFSAGPGEVTAIIGSTGSGKSTLINLIPRFYDATGGAVAIDGVDIRRMRRADLWRRIGFVPQKAFLFSGTIASNLRYGDEEATEEALWHALRVAQAESFVAELPDKLDAPVAQGGTDFSGGQRQRLAIARALVRRPEVYVFDDSFSALDFKTDSMLRAALRSEIDDATVIIVAQRVSTIMHADRIIVMDGGKVVGIGDHETLMERCETYREIVYSQLTQEEIA